MTAWADKAERGSTSLIRLIAWLALTAGRPACRVLLYPIVLYFLVFDRTARRASREFLGTALERRATLRDSFWHIYAFATTILDRVYMSRGDFSRFEITYVGIDLLDRTLSEGKGCVLLGSHLGSFDLMILAQQAIDGRPVRILMRVDPRSRVRRIAGVDDSALGVIELGRPDSLIRAYQELLEGSMVAVLADRVESEARLEVEFLGRTTALPTGAHVLAARSGAPTLMFFGLYEGGNRYRIEFVEFGEAAAADARGEALRGVVEHYAETLARYARKYPLNWFNFYPYWDEAGNR